MLVDINNGDPRDGLAFAALAAEYYFIGLIKVGDRRVAICTWEGRRVAVLLQRSLYNGSPEVIGAVTYVHLMTPELIDAPPSHLHYFTDPVFVGCALLIHEDEADDHT